MFLLYHRSNTESLEHPLTHDISVVASRHISPGSQVTTSYVSSSLANIIRRRKLFRNWNFWCSCDYCSDRTEAGTYSSALVCQNNKCDGAALPDDPLNNESLWSCDECGDSIDSDDALHKIMKAQQVLEEIKQLCKYFEEIEEKIFKLSKIVFHKNQILFEAHQKMLVIMLKTKILSRPMKERKVQILQSILQYLKTQDEECLKSRKYLNLYSVMIDQQIENLILNIKCSNNKTKIRETIKTKLVEKQALSHIIHVQVNKT